MQFSVCGLYMRVLDRRKTYFATKILWHGCFVSYVEMCLFW